MKTNELRKSYLDFFGSKAHKAFASDSLVPADDPSLLFTGAGMNQFKDHFLGKVKLDFTKATTCQKCLRTGDIDNASFTIVGDTLTTTSSFNFETKSSYTVRVRSTDAGGLFVESAFAITVADVNESPASLALSNASVAESATIGTAIGTLSTVGTTA